MDTKTTREPHRETGKPCTFWMPPTLNRKIQSAARREERTASYIVRRACEAELSRLGADKPDPAAVVGA